MTDSVEIFQKKGYCLLKSVVNPELRDFVTQYALFDEMQNFSPEGSQVPDAHSKYADPAMEAMLLHLLDPMQQATGLDLYPTYSYHRVYRRGDTLKPHTDRPSCEISITVCFNYSYDDEKIEWPIFMDGYRSTLKPGDAVVYRGCDLEHWREEFMCGDDDWHVQGFFHYVDKNGPFADHKFDKRESIGEMDRSVKNNSIKKPYLTFAK